MKREQIKKANKIVETIEKHKDSIGWLEEFNKPQYKSKYDLHYYDGEEKYNIFLEKDEIRLIINYKKRKIEELEKELEKL